MGLEINRVKYKDLWPKVRLKDVCNRISDGTHFTPTYVKEGVPFISVKDIYGDKVHFDKCKYIDDATHKELIKRCHPEKDDILITKSGTIGRMALVPEKPEFSLFVSVALIKNKKDVICSKFLKYCLENFLNSINVSQDLKGGLLKNFHLEDIRETVIPLVSVNEQIAIVSKIEELFSELDKSVAQLKTAQQQLKVYRQSVLKWAFEGKLTNENIRDGEFPDNWQWIKLKQVGNVVDPQPSHRTPPVSADGISYVSTKDFDFQNDHIDFSGARKVSKQVLQEHIERYKLQDGDFVIGKIGTIGRPVRIILPQNYTLSANIVLIQPRTINRKFLYYFFQTNHIEREFQKGSKATTQAAFGIKKVRELVIPYPPNDEQQQIVQEIESRISVADKLEETINNSLQQAEVLRQSIVKRAFEGRLF